MHSYFLNEAYQEALKAYDRLEVPVGCVIVRDNKIISRSHNETNKTHSPLAHAEVVGLENIEKEYNLSFLGTDIPIFYKNLTFYITCEPCVMCLGILNRIKAKIYFGCKNTVFGGISVLNIKSECIFIEDPRCFQILQKFYRRENVFAPEEVRKNKKNR